jgi:hypothetical protein
MEKELVIQENEEVTLKESQYCEVAKWVEARRKKSEEDRKSMIELGQRCEDAYNCKPFFGEDHRRKVYEDLYYPPYATEAIDSAIAHLQPTMIPRDDKWFILKSREAKDQDTLEEQEEWLQYCFDVDGFTQKFTDWLKVRLNWGSAGFKVTMKQEYSTAIGDTEPSLTFYSPSFSIIHPKDLFIYPVMGQEKHRTFIHRTNHTLGDLLDFNIDEEQGYFVSEEYKKWLMEEKEKKDEGTHTVYTMDEAWISEMRLPNGTMFQNVVATVVQGKYLIRFANNDYPNGRTPFLWDNGDMDVYGYPFFAKALDLAQAATGLFNDSLQAVRLGVSPVNTYLVGDDVFDPANVEMTAGALIPVQRHETLSQLQIDLRNATMAFEAMGLIQEQIESITVPKIIKAGLGASDNQTATASNHQQANATSRLRMLAYGTNTSILKPAVEMAYDLSHAIAVQELETYGIEGVLQDNNTLLSRVLAVTGGYELSPEELQEALDGLKPSRMLNISVIGYENSIQKQQQLQAIQGLAPFLQDPEAKAIYNLRNLSKQWSVASGLDGDFILKSEEEVARQQQQAQEAQQQQQQMMMQDAQQKMQLEVQKLQLEAQKVQAEVELRKADLALKNAELELKHLEFEQRSKMEEKNEEEAKKDKKKDASKATPKTGS